MDYSKLKTSFLLLLLMTIIQLLVAIFILHHTLITLLSIGAMLLCIGGLFYTNKHINDKKE
ncbi:hypothetical protein PBV87_22200 [Niameybacter massiliensis]|uniref:Uncharacterized protein n=1 Tax=Holtiella tumoricola TaxID=3018743 RepID=A0AA42DRN6_9FIRM|nr:MULTISPECIES: hypothetical protein [Lachnospirales]MDA3734189.1 hypothetical protein [Holtiella tumoricola]